MVNCHEVAENLFYYATPKIVHIKIIFFGVISRLIQIAILAYIVGSNKYRILLVYSLILIELVIFYLCADEHRTCSLKCIYYRYAIVYKKGYQEFSEVKSSVTSKVRGVIFTNFSDDDFNPEILHPEWYHRIWDVADYVIPPLENGATFIATNIIITENQTQGICAEDPAIEGALCDPENNACVAGKSLIAGNGVMTGNCIKRNTGKSVYSCEIQAWCPLEEDVFPLKNKRALLEDSQDFTILIKNFVDFPKFQNSNRRNIRDTYNSSYLRGCRYDPETDQDCPIFRLGDIVKWSGQKDFNSVAFQGGVIDVVINWECDLDFDKKYCFPTYEFNRLDKPNTKLAPGWNFRYANYYNVNQRTLYKMYGIRLSISVVGRAGQFRVIPLLTNVGAGLGLLALEVVICDILVLYLVKGREYFKSKKYEEVDTVGQAVAIQHEIPADKQDCTPERDPSDDEKLED